ncbi:MAG: tetratricopeptide repeat protein [Nanoarchaeota archaeon]
MIKTTKKQKLILIVFGIVFSLVLLEILLRVSGLDLLKLQRRGFIPEEDTYIILTIGESTTTDFYNDKSSWPRELERILNNQSQNIKFSVINEARPGTNTALILSRLDEQLDKYNPDMVISMMGVNDQEYTYIQDEHIKSIKFIFKQLRIYKLTRYIFGSWKTEFVEGYQHSLGKQINYSEKCNYNINLARENVAKEEFEDAIYILENSKDECRPNDIIYYKLGNIYHNNFNFSTAISMYEKAIEINPQSQDWVYFTLAETYRKQEVPVKEVEKFLQKNGVLVSWNNKSVVEITRIHYNKLYEKLKERGITYVAMQYPTLDVRMIKGMFANNETIIFVSNEENFKEALINHNYNELFQDNFAKNSKLFSGLYGHTTKQSNILIAENVANVILNELNITN